MIIIKLANFLILFIILLKASIIERDTEKVISDLSTDLDYSTFQKSKKISDELIKEPIISTFSNRIPKIPFVIWKMIFEFIKDCYFNKIISNPESFDTRHWIIVAEEMNLPRIFQRANAKQKWKILIFINRWLIKRFKLFPPLYYPNKKLANLKIVQMLKEMKKSILKECESEEFKENNKSKGKMALKSKKPNEFFYIIANMLGMDDNCQIPNADFRLFCIDNLLRWKELHERSLKDSIEHLESSPFSEFIFSELPKNGNFHSRLFRYLNRKAESSSTFQKSVIWFEIEHFLKKLKITG